MAVHATSPRCPVQSNAEALGRVAVVVPAYRPESGILLRLIEELLQCGFGQIAVVDDGSGPEYAHTFAALDQFEECIVLRHAVNLGKGRALKTGFNAILLSQRRLIGVVTADADGQHAPTDIAAVASRLIAEPSKFILGARAFCGPVPLRSAIGNAITRWIFAILVGKLSDTQTGLRGIPISVLPLLLRLDGERYDYEMNMLIDAVRIVPVVEHKISTIYIEQNRSSHFNPLSDSMRIYFVLLRFVSSSLASSLTDLAVFALMYHLTGNILASLLTGRAIIASLVNFSLNKHYVFHNQSGTGRTLAKYYCLFAFITYASYVSISALRSAGIGVLLAKIVVESTLFVVSFFIQRTLVFGSPKSECEVR